MNNMERYDYRQHIIEDIMDYIEENDVGSLEFDDLFDTLWVCDYVTGNGSGSYTYNRWQAEENLCHNFDLLLEAYQEFGIESMTEDFDAERADVTIRCYLLGECLAQVLDWYDEK